MNDNIVSLDENRPHAAGPVVCGRCQHSWVAVRPVGVIWCECPKCGAMFGASFMMHMAAFETHLGDECCGQKDSAGVCAAPACIRGTALKGVDTIRLAYFLEHPDVAP